MFAVKTGEDDPKDLKMISENTFKIGRIYKCI